MAAFVRLSAYFFLVYALGAHAMKIPAGPVVKSAAAVADEKERLIRNIFEQWARQAIPEVPSLTKSKCSSCNIMISIPPNQVALDNGILRLAFIEHAKMLHPDVVSREAIYSLFCHWKRAEEKITEIRKQGEAKDRELEAAAEKLESVRTENLELHEEIDNMVRLLNEFVPYERRKSLVPPEFPSDDSSK